LKRTHVARDTGISRGYLQKLLSAKSEVSLFVVTELSGALKFSSELELLSKLFERRRHLLDEMNAQDH
jgi:DNA-binding phage protein